VIDQYGGIDGVIHIKLRRLEWAGHLHKMKSRSLPKRTMEGRIYSKQPIVRPKDRWIDGVTLDAK